jgi:hypothetical protein
LILNIRTIFNHNKKAAAAAIVTAALFVLAAAVFLLVSARNSDTLVIRDAESGKVYARFDCPDGTQFEVEFLHSVNKSPVIDVFEASDGIIRVKEARYYTFGAGMPTEADQPTWEFSYAEDGAIVVTGITYTYDSLNYIVGTVHDHYLTIHGECINLRELCGRNAKIEIYQQK